MNDELVSIIVPIYNAEKYIKKCVNSIINQTYKNIEIILIDDGSTDKTVEICQKYQKEHNNIIFFSQKNQGVSVARNKGINFANGKYLTFVDADDFIDKAYIENLYLILKNNNSDLVISGAMKVSDSCTNKSIFSKNNDLFINFNEYKNKDKEKYILKIINTGNGAAVWGKMYVSALCKNIKMKSIRIGEDMLFNITYLQNSNSISLTSFIGYNYYINNKSVTNNFIPNVIEDLDNVIADEEDSYLIGMYTFRVLSEWVYMLYKNKLLSVLQIEKIGNFNNVMKKLNYLSKCKLDDINLIKRVYINLFLTLINKRKFKYIYILQKAKLILKK